MSSVYDDVAALRRRQHRRETGQLLAWSLMLGVLITLLVGAWFRAY